jgi:hypothetical protein
METKLLPFVEPPAIRTINLESKGAPSEGVESYTSWTLAHRMRGLTGQPIDRVSLGMPAVLGNRILVGTDTPGAEEQWLICLDASPGDKREEYVLGHCTLRKEEFGGAQWLHPELCLVTAGDGSLHLYTVSGTNALSLHGSLPPIHTAAIREMAVNQANRACFISGGYDKKVCLVDLERPDALQTLPQEDAIGSVRWPLANGGVCPSITLDNGTFLIFDNRVRPTGPPAFRATMGKKELYAHERYTDHNVLLGFGDGEFQHIDVRVTDRILHRVSDPLVQAVGTIEFNHDKKRVLITGLSSASVWNFDPVLGEMRLLADASRGNVDPKLSNETTHNAVFLGGDRISDCTSDGQYSLVNLPENPGASAHGAH